MKAAVSSITRSIVILDFGGQYAHLIASRIRRFGFKAYILPADTKARELRNASGIILSGGPQSVYEAESPQADLEILNLGIPVLGLCYGHQWLAYRLGGKVAPAKVKEYGPTEIEQVESGKWKVESGKWKVESDLFAGLPGSFSVWMSHGDEVKELPKGFVKVASSENCVNAAMMNEKRKIFGIQFHIEVTHTEHGMEILRSFVELCKPEIWSMKGYGAHVGEEILKEIGDRPHFASRGASRGKKVFMLVSGGVDSTVAFTLLSKVLGPDRVQGLLVDTGLMRKGEVAAIQKAFVALGIKNLHIEHASEEFFRNLKDVYDPEQKRKIIGNTFLSVQKRVFDEMGLASGSQVSNLKSQHWMLGQGTIYPDTIETGGTKHADTIKTHHNRVEIIRRMIGQGLVIEPLKELYKDEVRQLGEELGLPHDLVWRQPFPGPGLGVRILCAAAPALGGIPHSKNQIPEHSVVLPVRSVGVQGDGRTYRHVIALFSTDPFTVTPKYRALASSIPNASSVFNRVLLCTSHAVPFDPIFTSTSITSDVADLLREADAIVDEEMRRSRLYEEIWQFPVVLLPCGTKRGERSIVLRPIESTDAMTAAAFILPPQVLRRMTERIMKLAGIDAVFLDLTNKPPGTIEWE